MGQSEFYNDVKNKLEQRSLSPSDGAWDKLEVMLDNKDRSVMRRQYRRYFIAASMLLLFGLSYLYLSQENSITVEESLVNDEAVIDDTPNKNEVVSEVVIVENKAHSSVSEGRDNNELVKKQKHTKHRIKITSDAKNQPVLVLVDENIVQESNLEEVLVVEDVVSTKTARDVDAEVEALLADAMRKLPATDNVDKKGKEQSFYEVDEKALLATVEEELDISFKEKIFKKIKQGFQKTKTAVVKRNQDDFQNH